MGSRKSGRHVNASISNELRRWGIVHFPKNIPMPQSAIVMLTMHGSPGERQLEALFNARREDESEASQHDGAMVARSRRLIEKGLAVKDRRQEEKQICSKCLMSMISTPPTGQWLKAQMAELGLTSRTLAAALGVTDRAVKYWEQRGLPTHGTSARMVMTTLEKFFKEREARRN